MCHIRESLVLSFCIVKLSWAGLKRCSEDHEQLEICIKAKEGYNNPLPVVLNTDLYLLDIIDINMDKNSISVQVDLWTIWIDTGLALSNDSAM